MKKNRTNRITIMKNKKYKIIATFKYGRVWGNFALSMIVTLGITMTLGFAYFSIAVLLQENLMASIFILLVDAVLVGLFVVELIKGCKNRLYAKKCLFDAIEITTFAKYYDKDTTWGRSYKGVKISITFHYQNKKMRKHSVFDVIFERYVDRKIKVLYSPNCDGVLLYKENKNETN